MQKNPQKNVYLENLNCRKVHHIAGNKIKKQKMIYVLFSLEWGVDSVKNKGADIVKNEGADIVKNEGADIVKNEGLILLRMRGLILLRMKGLILLRR